MTQAAIFDGTLIDSVDLHAADWQQALARFGHEVTFEQARSQIGKGGDQLIPFFLTRASPARMATPFAPPWWTDGEPDVNRRMARNTGYAGWWSDVTSGGER